MRSNAVVVIVIFVEYSSGDVGSGQIVEERGKTAFSFRFRRGDAVLLAYTTVVGVIVKCTKFGQLILRKITKIVATRCEILRLKCTKLFVGWGCAQDPDGELTALSRPPRWILGELLLTEGRERKDKEKERGRRERGERSLC